VTGINHYGPVLAYLTLLFVLAVAWPLVQRERTWTIGALVVVAVIFVIHEYLYDTVSEDAFITYRYSQNLVMGHGPVFNLGQHVEGYSDFLWMVILAAARWVAGLPIEPAARFLGATCAVATLFATYALTVRLTHNRGAGVLSALLTGAIGSFAAWGPSGLEVPLFSLLVVLTLLTLANERYLLTGLTAALAIMTRPDGFIVVTVILAWLLGVSSKTIRSRLHSVGTMFGGLAIPIVPWSIWRISYYHYFIPNAIAAKAGMALNHQVHLGLQYFNQFSLSIQPALVLSAVALAFFLPSRKEVANTSRTFWLLLVAVVIAYCVYVVLIGGDWMPAFRFFAPITPVFAIATVATLHWGLGAMPRLVSSQRGNCVVTCAVAAILLAVDYADRSLIPSIRVHRVQVEELAEVGRWFHATLPGGTVIATFPNGSLSFFAGTGFRMIDMNGLTDEFIARHGHRNREAEVPGHVAYDYRYVASERPDIVFDDVQGLDRMRSCVVYRHFTREYVGFTFERRGERLWADMMIRRDERSTIVARLSSVASFVPYPCPPTSQTGHAPPLLNEA